MANTDAELHWTDDERYYEYSSSRDSDDSPIFRKEKHRYGPAKVYGRSRRRTTLGILAKFFLVCMAMILFCCILYVPVFMRLNRHEVRAVLDGWSMDTSRDTRLYVRPYNRTTLFEPDDVCPKTKEKKKLFLLIIVCSDTNNHERRSAIRNTWGDYKKYLKLSKVFNDVREKYKSYNYSYSLFPSNNATQNSTTIRHKRNISSYNNLLPELAKAFKRKVDNNEKTVKVPAKDNLFQQFDMNKVLGSNDININYDDYEYAENVMKIPRIKENRTDTIDSLVVDYLAKSQVNNDISEEYGNIEPDFKLIFLMGLPTTKDAEEIQNRIDSEVNEYNDIIQEDFLDTYNNLTLKSIMMLKWITNNCKDSVRYILKTDDDVYVNVPNLMLDLRNRSRIFDERAAKYGDDKEEHFLIGDLICGARPVLNSRHKWYSPRYMFSGAKYPHYLSGSAYAFTEATGRALYNSTLSTSYFHLEDIFITGMVPKLTVPPLRPTRDKLFTFSRPKTACSPHKFATTHRIDAKKMYLIVSRMMSAGAVEFCEKDMLEEVRLKRLQPDPKPHRPLNRITKDRLFHLTVP